MKLLEECKQAKRIGISGHIRPDGDCVGSCMGLYLYLKKVRPDADLHIFLENRLIFSAASAVWKKLTANTASRNALMCFSPWILRPTAWEEQKRISTAL